MPDTSPQDSTATENPLLPDAMRLLALIGEAPTGLSTDCLYGNEASEALRDAYVACSHSDYAVHVHDHIVLTDAGAALLGLQRYRGNDPSTWPAAQAEKMFLRGYCHALAVALHRLHGHELVMAAVSGMPFHVLVRREDGMLLDYDGETTMQRIRQDSGLGATARSRLKIVPLEGEDAMMRIVIGRLAPLMPEHIAMAMRFVQGNPERFQQVSNNVVMP